MYTALEELLPKGTVLREEPLRKHTTFRIGGPADVMVLPQNETQLLCVLTYIRENRLRYLVIGNGSNLLFPDAGFSGIVIKLGTEFGGMTLREEGESVLLHAGAGALLSRVANTASEAGLSDLAFAAGIPGSVGGAIFMNAGAYDGEISRILLRSTYIDPDTLEIREKSAEAHLFSYRSSSYQQERNIILSGDFHLQRSDKEEILRKMKDFAARRSAKQPLEYPSAGSAFKRPRGDYAGRLIDACGLRGCRFGNAMVSEKHCGFIVNLGGATCEDVRHVIEYVRATVFERTGILLETEIRIIEG